MPAPYTRAYACFGIKVVVAPNVPNNWASLAPFQMDIPGDCILNAPHPYPVSARNATGQLLPDLMMGCLHQIVPERVAAEGRPPKPTNRNRQKHRLRYRFPPPETRDKSQSLSDQGSLAETNSHVYSADGQSLG